MLAALTEYFPPEVSWTHPQGGLFLWVTLPEGLEMEHLFQAALRENVAFVPGDCFYATGDEGRRHMRLNFSHSNPQQIREGIRRLGLAVAREMAAHQPREIGRASCRERVESWVGGGAWIEREKTGK